MLRKAMATFIVCLPIAALFLLVVKNGSGGVTWLARDGRSVVGFGDASINAPIPFQGSLWSVWGTVQASGEGGGWQTTVKLDDRPCDFVAKIGLHPDYYEIGRTDGVLLSAEVIENNQVTELWAAMFSPGLKGRRAPFRSVRINLERWRAKRIMLKMKARPYGKNTIVVIWVEPRIEPSAEEES